jgi:thymidine kinase
VNHVYPHDGWVEVIAGCMFSGKTEELIRRLNRAIIAKQSVVVFKPIIDDRYAKEEVASHGGVTIEAIPVSDPQEIYDRCKEADVVGVDEVQFFDESVVEVVQALANEGKRVICAMLDMDYRGVPFGAVPGLMATAEEVDKVHAVCVCCGGPATRSQRIVDSSDQVLVGGADAYEARCRRHWSPNPVFSAARKMDRLED